jgi:putative hydrolase of the HAD superfamily
MSLAVRLMDRTVSARLRTFWDCGAKPTPKAARTRKIMKIKGIIFDVNGTMINIHTDEHYSKIYRFISRFLTFHGISVHHGALKEEYFQLVREQRHSSREEHPEYDVQEVWREFLRRRTNVCLCPEKLEHMSGFLAELFRGISRRRLELYPGVRETLDDLRSSRRLAVLSDAQKTWALPELRTVGIDSCFEHFIISGEHGFRKPDRRLFEMTLSHMGLAPWEVLHVGNDMYRDVFGPKRLGIKTVFFSSNQGRKHMDNVEPDYVIHNFWELRQAVDFFEQTH